MGVFLEINGAPLSVDEVELYNAVTALAASGIGEEELAACLRRVARTGGGE